MPDLCQASMSVPTQRAKERLPRREGDRRGGTAPNHEVRGNEDRRSARPAGATPGARTIGQPTYRYRQSDSRLACGARRCGRQGLRFSRAELPGILTTPPDVLSPRMVHVIEGLAEDWRRLDERIEHLSGEIAAVARQDSGCRRLMSVPGVEPIISSAMVAAIGTGDTFAKGRRLRRLAGPRSQADLDRGPHHPRQHIQARQSVSACPVRAGSLGRADQAKELGRHGLKPWIEAANKRLHRDVPAIALANKLAHPQ